MPITADNAQAGEADPLINSHPDIPTATGDNSQAGETDSLTDSH